MYVSEDRLGSPSGVGGVYYPYGENIGNAPMDPGGEGFATYYEDWYGQNYADQRYYNSIGGRFLTPDPGGIRTADPKNPTSWNRYAYANGDPVNFNDPAGAFGCPVGYGEGEEIVDCELSPPMTYPPNPTETAAAFNDAHGYTAFPQCNPTGSPSEEADLNFIYSNYSAASKLAQESGVNVNWLLAWAAEESGYGSSGQANNNNNFVNESLPSGGVTGGWVNAVTCPSDASPGWACFNSLFDSLFAALYTEHGSWSYSGQSTPSGLSVIDAILAANPSASISDVFQGVADAGFDPPGTPTNAGYGGRISNVSKGVTKRVDCLKKEGDL
jgi:RHS repeat-associated protein